MMRIFAAAVAAGLLAAVVSAGPPGAAPPPDAGGGKLVAHEWGTFTSFSGADGVPVGFHPDNSGLPDFVYRQDGADSKSARLDKNGTVSLETPVVYFYSDKETRASVRVDFPKGWITEWYPAAAVRPAGSKTPSGGQSIRWDVRLLAGDRAAEFPRGAKDNSYYRARETDALGLQVETPDVRRGARGGVVVQREKFLFYRGVGTFPPPVTVRALGGGKVRVTSADRGKVGGLVLLTVRGGKVGFRPLGVLPAGAETEATLPEPTGTVAETADHIAGDLTAAGLYPKEARAMVRTWESAWFGEDGVRLMYLVPRERTDELLPLTIEPKPAEVVRVLVGRHEFLTPEREAVAEQRVAKARTDTDETGRAAVPELKDFGRFAREARAIAEKRLAKRPAGR